MNSYLSCDAPIFDCLIREQYLYNHERGRGSFIQAKCCGVAFRTGWTPTFDVLLDNGAYWTRLPIIALCWKNDAEELLLQHQILWDCPSQLGNVRARPIFANKKVLLLCEDGEKRKGEYIYTVECAYPDGKAYKDSQGNWAFVKVGHLIKAEDGNFFMYPNYRVIWDSESSLNKLGYKVDVHDYSIRHTMVG